MNKELKLTYGKEKINLSIPEDFLAGDLIKPKKSGNKITEAEMKGKIEEAIKNPIDSLPVKDMVEGKKVGLVISDEFRSGLQELIVSVMMNEIFKGNPESLDIFIANGTHDPKVYCKNLVAKTSEVKNVKESGKFFKALSDPTRLRIIKLLKIRSMCVCEIMIALELTQPTASHHLSILEGSRLVEKRRQGKWIFYSIANQDLLKLVERIESARG